MHRAVFAFAGYALAACSAEAPSSWHAAPSPTSGDGAAFVAPTSVPVGFARRSSSEIVAFDPANGRDLASLALGGVVLDLSWDPRGRLLAVEQSPEQDSSRVRAFSFGAAGFSELAVSDVLPPETRVAPFGSWALVMAEDVGVSWSLLDAPLVPVAPSRALFRPSGLVIDQDRILALNPTLLVAGANADEIVRARFDQGWQLWRQSFVAAGRPGSRLGWWRGRAEVWLVRKLEQDTRIEFAKVRTRVAEGPESFHSIAVPGATGALESVVVVTSEPRFVLLLSRGAAAGALVSVSTDAPERSELTELAGAIEHTEWVGASIARVGSGRLLVADGAGLHAFWLKSNASLEADRAFEASGLAAPFTGTW